MLWRTVSRADSSVEYTSFSFGGDRVVIVLLHETLKGNAVEPAAPYTHAMGELVRSFEDGIRNRYCGFHTNGMTRV